MANIEIAKRHGVSFTTNTVVSNPFRTTERDLLDVAHYCFKNMMRGNTWGLNFDMNCRDMNKAKSYVVLFTNVIRKLANEGVDVFTRIRFGEGVAISHSMSCS
jgi:hypothetical protein